MIQKQTIYLPVKVEDELPLESCKCGIIKNEEFDLSYFIKAPSYNVFDHVKSGLYHKQTEITHWLKPQEGYFFTSKQLNEYTANVVRQALETAAEKSKIIYTKILFDDLKEGDNAYMNFPKVDKQSIMNSFEETYKKFEV